MSKLRLRGIVSGTVFGGIVVLGAVAILGNKTDVPRAPAGVYDPRIPGVVCGGTPWTLQEATRAMPFNFLYPHHAFADAPELKQVWRCSDIDFALEYSSGVVIYQGVNTLPDPEAVWRRMAELYPEFSVGTVRGISAKLSDPSKAVGASGGVDFVEGNVRITVAGDGKIPLSALVEIAESLSAKA